MNETLHPSAIRAFARAQWAAILAAVLAVVAMMQYPGGTPLDHNTSRYRLTQNFLSDLGMTVAYDGQPNRIGAALFVVALGLLILGFGGATWWFIRLYSITPTARTFAWGAGAVGLIVCLSFVGVGLAPENSAMGLHVQFTLFAFRVFPFACLLMLLAAWKSGGASSKVIAIWLFATACLTAYAAFLSLGAPPTTPDGLVVSVIAQKSVVVAIAAALTYLCYETARVLRVAPTHPHSLTAS